MVRDRRAADSPLAHLQGGNARVDRRHDRRALSADELRRLLTAVETGPTRMRMSGQDRAMLYRLAVETGLRANELRTLTWGSFDLDAEPATVTVRAAYSKHRRDDVLPLKADMAVLLARWQTIGDGTDSQEPVFPTMPSKTANMVRSDLADAGIDYHDEAGRVADFHALRHTFITNLARGGVHPKLAQALARHSTITLTMDRYSHTVIGEQADALTALPDLNMDTPDAEPMRATGTCDPGGKRSADYLAFSLPEGDSRRFADVHRNDTNRKGDTAMTQAEKPTRQGVSCASVHQVSSSGTNTPGRTRTCDFRIRNPMLKNHKPLARQALTNDTDDRLADCLAFLAKNDPDLAAVIAAWPRLPKVVKAGVLAMVKAAGGCAVSTWNVYGGTDTKTPRGGSVSGGFVATWWENGRDRVQTAYGTGGPRPNFSCARGVNF